MSNKLNKLRARFSTVVENFEDAVSSYLRYTDNVDNIEG